MLIEKFIEQPRHIEIQAPCHALHRPDIQLQDIQLQHIQLQACRRPTYSYRPDI